MAKPDRKTFQARSNELLASIRSDIVRGTYKPGDYLPAETALAEQFRLSKNSVRLVLDKLVEEGLIVKLPRIGNQVTNRPKKTTIRFGVYPSMYAEVQMNRLVELFQQAYPHIQVELMELPYAHPDHIRQLIQFGVLDAATLNHRDYLHFRESDHLDLLEPSAPNKDTYPFLNAMFAAADRQTHVQPFIFSPVILCYNKEHFEKQRVFEPDSSWDWEGLRSALLQLAQPDRYGLFFHVSSTNRWPIFLLQNDVAFVRDEQGYIRPAKPGMLEVLRKIRGLIHEERLFPLIMAFGLHDVESLFKQQKVSVILTTYYRLNELVDAKFPIEIAQLPKSNTNSTLLLSTGVIVGATSCQKEAAVCFSDFLLSDGVQAFIRRHTYSLPANKRVTEAVPNALPGTPARLELHREMIPSYTTHDKLGLSIGEVEALGECLEQYFSGLVDEEGLMDLFNRQLQGEKNHPGSNN